MEQLSTIKKVNTRTRFRDVPFKEIAPCVPLDNGPLAVEIWEKMMRGREVWLVEFRTDNPHPEAYACDGPYWLTDFTLFGPRGVCAHMIEID